MPEDIIKVGPDFTRMEWVRGDSQSFDIEADFDTIDPTGATCQITGKQGSTTVFSPTPTVTVTGSQIATFTWDVTAAEAAAFALQQPIKFDAEITVGSNVYTVLRGTISVVEDQST